MIVEQDIYTAPIPYIISTYIREYDISKANINILYHEKQISDQQYQFLYSCPKFQREIIVGKMRKKNQNLTAILKNGIKNARIQLCIANHLTDENILSVKNDAVFVIDRDLKYTQFDNIRFAHKNTYTSYYKIYNMEFYYDGINDVLDVKGMGDSLELYHGPYFTDLLKFLFSEAEKTRPTRFMNTLTECIQSYIHLEYPVEYYREFNNRSMYKSKINISGESYYMASMPHDTNPICLDISYNFGILMTLYGYIEQRALNY